MTRTMQWGPLPRPHRRQVPVILLAGLIFFIGAPVLFATAAFTGNAWALLAGTAAVAASVSIVIRSLSSARQSLDTSA
jgi:hypothetical protein